MGKKAKAKKSKLIRELAKKLGWRVVSVAFSEPSDNASYLNFIKLSEQGSDVTTFITPRTWDDVFGDKTND